MNASTLKHILKEYPVIVTSSDNLRYHNDRFCISNTKPYWEKGQHWIVVYKPSNGPREFFDSLNKSPEDYGFYGLEPCVKTITRLQRPYIGNCGQLCALYVKLRYKGYSLLEIERWMYRTTLAAPRC